MGPRPSFQSFLQPHSYSRVWWEGRLRIGARPAATSGQKEAEDARLTGHGRNPAAEWGQAGMFPSRVPRAPRGGAAAGGGEAQTAGLRHGASGLVAGAALGNRKARAPPVHARPPATYPASR